MSDRHPHDEVLIVASLIEFYNRHSTTDPARANRALSIATEMAESHGLTPADAIRQSETPARDRVSRFTRDLDSLPE